MNVVLLREWATREKVNRVEAALTTGGLYGDWRILARTPGGIMRRRLRVLPPPRGAPRRDALDNVIVPGKALLQKLPSLRQRLGLAFAAIRGRPVLVNIDRAASRAELELWTEGTRAD